VTSVPVRHAALAPRLQSGRVPPPGIEGRKRLLPPTVGADFEAISGDRRDAQCITARLPERGQFLPPADLLVVAAAQPPGPERAPTVGERARLWAGQCRSPPG